MRVFIAGATGVLGRPTVRRLVAAGHDVTGVARTAAKAELLRSMGADAARIDVWDSAALGTSVKDHDMVVHMATHIPPTFKATRQAAWAENDRLRRELTPMLAEAARAAG